VATQFHPEFKSRPETAHPLFVGMVQAALKRLPVVEVDADDIVADEVTVDNVMATAGASE
jgi:CTP synthase